MTTANVPDIYDPEQVEASVYAAYLAELAPLELALEQELARRAYHEDHGSYDHTDDLADIEQAMADIADRYREALA